MKFCFIIDGKRTEPLQTILLDYFHLLVETLEALSLVVILSQTVDGINKIESPGA